MLDAPTAPTAPTARFLGRAAATLIAIALLTGFLVAAAMGSKIPADAHSMLASHLNAMLGGFWILGVAWSLPFLRYGAKGRARLAWAVVIANYANWAVTGLKAFLRVSGVDYLGEPKNDLIFGLLSVLVVVPSLGAAFAWAWGFKPAAALEPRDP